MASHGLVLNNAGHVTAIYPDLFRSRDAAKKALARVLAGVDVLSLNCMTALSCLVRYQVDGQGNVSAMAFVTPERLATLRNDLEAVLGPLALFKVLSPTPKEITAMTDAAKLAIRARMQGADAAPAGTAIEVPGGYGNALPPSAMLPPGWINEPIGEMLTTASRVIVSVGEAVRRISLDIIGFMVFHQTSRCIDLRGAGVWRHFVPPDGLGVAAAAL
jgi:hypothetical protein